MKIKLHTSEVRWIRLILVGECLGCCIKFKLCSNTITIDFIANSSEIQLVSQFNIFSSVMSLPKSVPCNCLFFARYLTLSLARWAAEKNHRKQILNGMPLPEAIIRKPCSTEIGTGFLCWAERNQVDFVLHSLLLARPKINSVYLRWSRKFVSFPFV